MLRTQVFFHSFPRRCKVYQPSNLRESKFRRVRAGLWAPGKSNEPTPDDSDPWEAHPIEKYETANWSLRRGDEEVKISTSSPGLFP